MTELAWPAVVVAGIVLFWLPVLIAAIRGVQRTGVVVLATLLTVLFPPAWFAAIAVALRLPGKNTARRGAGPSPARGPAYWQGEVPPAGVTLVDWPARRAVRPGVPARV